MYHTFHCKIIGVSPLIMHNGQLADPLNPLAKAMKQLSGKRDKTDADLAELARLEWYGSLYLEDGAPCMPGEVLEAHLIESAKKRKKGPQAKAGIYCDGNSPLLYEGPRDPEALWAHPEFRLTVGARVQRNRVMRTRPIFREWALRVQIAFNDTLLNTADTHEFLRLGGEHIGLGDWRPKFGRFEVQEESAGSERPRAQRSPRVSP
jgi:hypothetical protein